VVITKVDDINLQFDQETTKKELALGDPIISDEVLKDLLLNSSLDEHKESEIASQENFLPPLSYHKL